MLLLLLALLAQPAPQPATVVRGPAGGSAWFHVALDADPLDMDGDRVVSYLCLGEYGRPARIAWHLDPRVELPASDLYPGVRVRLTRAGATSSTVTRVEVASLGPLSLAAAVEEFVAESCGARWWLGLTPGEVATIDAMGSRSWLVRDSVSRSLFERRGRSLGVLMRARRHPDREVRARAEGVLRDLGWDRD